MTWQDGVTRFFRPDLLLRPRRADRVRPPGRPVPVAGGHLLPVHRGSCPDSSSGAEFTEVLNAIPARKVVVIFDCCHSGGISQPRDLAAPEYKAGLSESYYDEALKAGRGRVILASSRSTEYSYVLPGAEYGLFTEHLLSGLRGGVASDDGLVRIFDLFEYLQPRVTHAHPRPCRRRRRDPLPVRRPGNVNAWP